MRGAIAAGHEVTAETGARVLAQGGNAVDACVAAAFASWVAESTPPAPGGGGFMLVHRARDRGARLLDFFVAVPGRGLPPHERAAMQQVDVDFDRATSQVFHIGAASVGVPGTPAGLEAAYRAYGTKPWPELVAPAVELAREGIELTRPQAYLHAILDLILRHTDEGRRIYERNGERLIAGDRLTMPDLANTLERIAERGVRELYDGEAGRPGAARRPRRAGGHARNDPDLGRRCARERGLDDRVHRRRVGRDRARYGRAPEQHARRVRPRRREPAAGHAPDEHDGPVHGAAGRPPAPRRRQRRLGAAARRDPPDREQRRRPRARRARGDRPAAHAPRGAARALRGRLRPCRGRPARGDGLRGDALAAAEPLLRRRLRGRRLRRSLRASFFFGAGLASPLRRCQSAACAEHGTQVG